MAVPAFTEPPEVPADIELTLSAHTIARKLCGSWPPGIMPVAYPLIAASVYELLDQGVIEIGPHLHG